MTIDMPAKRLDFRATSRVDTSDTMKVLLEHFAHQWPEYQPVRHTIYGTYGVVRDDSPANIPYAFDGRPGRVCIGPDGEEWVSVVWNPASTFPLRTWAPARALATIGRRW